MIRGEIDDPFLDEVKILALYAYLAGHLPCRESIGFLYLLKQIYNGRVELSIAFSDFFAHVFILQLSQPSKLYCISPIQVVFRFTVNVM